MMKTSAVTRELIPLFDDGWMENLWRRKNLSLKFRGSENQRVLNVKKSLEEGRGLDGVNSVRTRYWFMTFACWGRQKTYK